jgi:WD40 repeat protein
VTVVKSLRGALSPRGSSPPPTPHKIAPSSHTRTRSGSLRSSAEIARLLNDPEFREELRLNTSPLSSPRASLENSTTEPPLFRFVQHPSNKIKGHLIETAKDKLIVAVGEEIHVWDLKNEELLILFTGHSSPVNCLTLVNDAEECVSCSNTETLVWSLRTGECTHSLTQGAKAVGVFRTESNSVTSPPSTPSTRSSTRSHTTNSYRVITAHLTQPICTLWSLHTPTHALTPLRQLTGHKVRLSFSICFFSFITSRQQQQQQQQQQFIFT